MMSFHADVCHSLHPATFGQVDSFCCSLIIVTINHFPGGAASRFSFSCITAFCFLPVSSVIFFCKSAIKPSAKIVGSYGKIATFIQQLRIISESGLRLPS
jgi:hypothetical protein